MKINRDLPPREKEIKRILDKTEKWLQANYQKRCKAPKVYEIARKSEPPVQCFQITIRKKHVFTEEFTRESGIFGKNRELRKPK